VDTESANGDQFLRELNSVTLFGDDALAAGSGAVTLAGGTFTLNGTIASDTTVTAGTLSGTGVVEGSLDVRGGTVSPGLTTGILRSGDVTFDSTSAFRVELNGTSLTPTPQYDQLKVDGNVDLGGVTLTGTAGILARGTSFTIVEATGTITGQFAQGSEVTLGGAASPSPTHPQRRPGPNTPPVVNDSTEETNEDTALALTAGDFTSAYSDADADALVTIRVLSLPTHGVLTLGGVPVTIGQEIAAADLGSLVFTPDTNWNGTTSFSWTASDGLLYAASPATLSIQVRAVNDAPVNAVPPAQTGHEDVWLPLTGLAVADLDVAEGTGVVEVTLSVEHGTLTLGGTGGLTFTAGGNGGRAMTFTGALADVNAAWPAWCTWAIWTSSAWTR
jgi:hypothetical protein